MKPNHHSKNIAGTLPEGAKILFANFPGDGHFNPLTGLAVHLKKMGYDVRWYTSPYYEQKVNKLGIPFYPFKKALDFNGETVDQVFPERRKIKSQVAKLKYDIINAFILRGEEYYEDLKDIHASFPFDLLIADVAFTGIPFVQDRMKIPVISIGIFPLCETSNDLAPNGLGITPSYSFFGQLKQSFLRFFADNVLFREPNRVLIKMFKKHGIGLTRGNVFDAMVRKSTLVLQSGTPSFEYYRSDLGQNIRFIGPLLPSSKIRKNRWYNEKLSQYEKVVLVTQGTVEKDVNKIIVPTLEALKNENVLVVVTTGGSHTAELQTRYNQQNFIIEDFIPFSEVMPYADVYVTNGGYGGVMMSIENELPLVVAGVNEGKNEIGARVGYFDLGINLKTETPTPTQIKKSVEQLLSNGTYRENVTRLSKEFDQYKPREICAYYVNQLLNREEPVPKKRKSFKRKEQSFTNN